MLDGLLRDLRSTAHLLAARPVWTIAAILCLAIATGANTAAFTLVNGLFLRPLPFDEPERLVMVTLREPTQTTTRPFSLREYRALAEQSGTTAQLLARTFFPSSLAAGDGARMVQTELVSGNYFETLRVTPFLGRFFDGSDDLPGSAPVGVMSHRLWQLRFGADPSVIGRTVRLNHRAVTIAGIAPPDFVGAMQLIAADLWLPAAAYADLAGSIDAETVPMFGVMGRLAPAIAPREAEAHLTSLATRLDRAAAAAPPSVIVVRASGFGVPPVMQGTMFTLSGFIYAVMALLMAVACANVAALVLARGVGRAPEIAVRLSLGASRLHIARQLLTESVALALAGSAAGIVVGLWATQALVARLTTPFEYVSYAIDVRPDARVFAYSAIATALAAVLCGIAPVRYAGRVDILDVLKRGAARGRSRESLRTLNVIVMMQFAVSAVLLVGAAVLVRSYVNAELARPGFSTTGLVAASLDVDQIRLDRAAGTRFFASVMDRLSALPGVADVSLTRNTPFAPARTVTVVADAGARSASTAEPATVAALVVSPRYFRTLGVAILQGRAFDDADPPRPRVAIVNEAMARRVWPGAPALGRTFRIEKGDGEPIEVIGIVPDTRDRSLAQRPQPAFYQPFPHEYSARMTVLMRVRGDRGTFFGELRRTMRDVNPDLSIVDLRTVDELFDLAVDQRRVPATAVSLVGVLGLVLSAIGLYGVVAYGVRERAREIGIRLALGARPADVRWMVVRQGLTLVGVGLAVGAMATVALALVVRRVLFGVDQLDLLTVAAVCVVLIGTGLAALYVPALSASRVEPAATLRSE